MLKTQRLVLSEVQEADRAQYSKILCAPETSRFSDMPRNPTERKTREFVDWMIKSAQRKRGAAWMIRLEDCEPIVGCIRLNRMDRKTLIATIGYELAKEHWGKGYMSEALDCLAAHSFNALGMFRLEAWTLAENKASVRVLEKSGFTREGVQRLKFVDGSNRHDVCLFAKLRDD